MNIECYNRCYHCKVELQENNKQYCPEHLEVYNELFNEFQEFYELNNEKIRITRIKYFKASTRRYIRHYLNNDYDGIPISIYMDVNGWSEEYFEKIYIAIHEDDFKRLLNLPPGSYVKKLRVSYETYIDANNNEVKKKIIIGTV